MTHDNGTLIQRMLADAREIRSLDQTATRGKRLGEAIVHAARAATALHVTVLGGNPVADSRIQAGRVS